MSRTNLKVADETKRALDTVKHDGETWDECLLRLVQLYRATLVDGGENDDLSHSPE